MKILLLKPISPHYYVIEPNLGLGYLATIILDAGHQVDLLDAGKEKLSRKEFVRRIRKEKYQLVGIQVFTHELESVKKHAPLVKKHSPQTTVIVGGPHVSGDPQGTLETIPEIDFGFTDEAEIGLDRFIQLDQRDYARDQVLATIPNLVWRKNQKVIGNPQEGPF